MHLDYITDTNIYIPLYLLLTLSSINVNFMQLYPCIGLLFLLWILSLQPHKESFSPATTDPDLLLVIYFVAGVWCSIKRFKGQRSNKTGKIPATFVQCQTSRSRIFYCNLPVISPLLNVDVQNHEKYIFNSLYVIFGLPQMSSPSSL